MTEYKLLYGETVKKLNEEVAAKLKDGWQVHGSPFAFGMHNQPSLILQAVIRWPEPQAWLGSGQPVETLPVPPALADEVDTDEEVKRFFGIDGEKPFRYGYDS